MRTTVPIRRVVEQQGQPARRYLAYAICEPRQPDRFDAPAVVEATMLFVPLERLDFIDHPEAPLGIGTSCRVCARENCPARREPLVDLIIRNLMAGYQYVNMMLDEDINPLKREGLRHFLELNHILLCGPNPNERVEFYSHIQATSDRFYAQKEFSIKDVRSYAEKHKKDSAWKQAAGVYIMHLSQPQLFLEGNHRTGALLMSCILVRNGKPPFVLSVENAKAYFDPSTLAKCTNKDFLGKLYKLPKLTKKFAKFLKAQADEDLLTKVKK